MTFEQWEADVPVEIRSDPVWRVEAYRIGLFLSDLAWADTARLAKQRLYRDLADQLARAMSNISSNVCEGYSRSSIADRARFYEYALGSARESRDWYYKCRRAFRGDVVHHRLGLLNQIISLLVAMITNERRRPARITKRS